MHFIALHYSALHSPGLQCTFLPFTVHCSTGTSLPFITVHCTAPYQTHFKSLPCTTVYFIALYYSALPCPVLNTFHFTALYYSTTSAFPRSVASKSTQGLALSASLMEMVDHLMYTTLLHCTLMHYTPSHCKLLPCTVLNLFSTVNCRTLNYWNVSAILHCTVLHCIVQFYTALYRAALYLTMLHCMRAMMPLLLEHPNEPAGWAGIN